MIDRWETRVQEKTKYKQQINKLQHLCSEICAKVGRAKTEKLGLLMRSLHQQFEQQLDTATTSDVVFGKAQMQALDQMIEDLQYRLIKLDRETNLRDPLLEAK